MVKTSQNWLLLILFSFFCRSTLSRQKTESCSRLCSYHSYRRQSSSGAIFTKKLQFLFFVQRMRIISILFCQMLAYFCDWNNALFKWEKFVRASLVCLPLQAGRITPPPARSGKRAAGIWHYSSIDAQRSGADIKNDLYQIRAPTSIILIYLKSVNHFRSNGVKNSPLVTVVLTLRIFPSSRTIHNWRCYHWRIRYQTFLPPHCYTVVYRAII